MPFDGPGTKMKWKVVTKLPDAGLGAQWEEFLTQADYPAHYTTPNFFVDPFIRGGERFSVLSFDDDGRISGVLSGVDAGKKIVSGLPTRPQLAFRKNIDRQEAARSLLAGVREKGGDDLELIQLHAWAEVTELGDLGLRRQENGGDNSTMMLDLSKGADEIFKGFSQTRRNELRKAIKQGVIEVKELETDAELGELYEIHKDWNLRKGNRPDAFEDISLAARQREHRRIFIATYEGKVVAGSFYRFCRGGIVEYAANNSMPEYQRLRPNDLIGWHAIRWACDQGFPLFSMGGSHLFLRRFGGTVWPTFRYSLDSTFLKRYEKREQIEALAHRLYTALPDSARSKMKQVLGKIS